MTQRAQTALDCSEVIVGYTAYVDLVRPFFPDKTFLTTSMRGEVERCEMAVKYALEGRTVALICSGDAGVYGMASPALEAAQRFPQLDIEVVPGVTAACSGAALLGAPLSHDFAVVSLSDLLTPWALIEKRLACAAEADFVLCLYNPSSKSVQTISAGPVRLSGNSVRQETPVGVVRSIGREGESWTVMTLEELRDYQADMFTTVFIGNSQTRVINGRLVTPRGYIHQ